MPPQTNTIILHLSLIPDIGPSTVARLLERVAQLADLYRMSAADIIATTGIAPKRAAILVHGLANQQLVEHELQLIEKHAISWMTFRDPLYPPLLSAISSPPAVLYWQGASMAREDKNMAVVGARKADAYGQYAIDSIVPALVAQQWVIVSGGAVGADSMAHQAAVRAGGKTIAILGSGLLRPYPPENKQLFADIVARGGTIMSACALTVDPLPENFPARNRIISGLSRGCVVVQAAKKSGASITAHCALEQGRDVFAVPGPINDSLSAGCHTLIQQGAKLTTSAEDILQEYGELAPAMVRQQTIKFPCDGILVLGVPTKRSEDGVKENILKACAQPLSLDELMEATNMPLSDLTEHLFQLQVEGLVEQDFSGNWCAR
jgi:DNA processing protein